MPEPDDTTLLRAYVERRSEEAFSELVLRHVNKVYSVAWRKTGNASAAQEITQAVFVILARKAPSLSKRVIVSAWLYQTARWTALAFARGAARRRRREEAAFMQSANDNVGGEVWREIAPFLETAMGRLSEADRSAIVLRFFDDRSLKEVAAALGVKEEAAKKRIERSLEKLRTFLAKRGIHSTTAVIAAAISTNSVQAAPEALAKSASSAALAKGLASTHATTTSLIKGALKLMIWNQLKLGALACAGLLAAVGTTTIAVKTARAEAQETRGAEMLAQFRRVFAQDLAGPDLRDAAVQIMTNHPPLVFLRTSTVLRGELMGKTSGMATLEGRTQIGAALIEILRAAYGLAPRFPQNRIIVPPDLLFARYDYIDTVGGDAGQTMLREALMKQFGLTARHEIRKNLLLVVNNPAAPGLHPHDAARAGEYRVQNITMAQLAPALTRQFGVKVTDQTGLKGSFDYTLTAPDPVTPDRLQKALADQLGLALAPAADGEEIDFLVAEKTAP